MEKPEHKHYERFSSGDFILDPFFQNWIMEGKEERDRFWRDFLETYPHRRREWEAARDFLLNLSFREHFPETVLVESAFVKHLSEVEAIEETINKKKTRIRKIGWAAAALVAGVVALTVFFSQLGGNQDVQEITGFGMKKQVMLPDGSTVVLNANSSVSFGKEWNGDQSREVWLRGEGYFDVKKKPEGLHAGQKFLVHTGVLTVEVLGTRFDIRERRGVTEVVLEEGSIALSFVNRAHQGVRMVPGEMIVYDPVEGIKEKDTTNAVNYTAWKKNRLMLRNPTVKEIGWYLEDNFGYKMVLEDEKMGETKIEGPILYDSLNDVLFILSTVLHTEVIRKDSTIIFRPR